MADEKVNVSPEERKPRKLQPRPGRAIRLRRNIPRGPLSLVGIRRPPLMWSLPRQSILLSLVWVRTLPRRPAR